jgi:signal transduction histidine kinase
MSGSAPPDTAAQPSSVLDSLRELATGCDIGQFLTAALHETIQAVDSEAGSLLFAGDRTLRIAEGDVTSGINEQIALWEEALLQRLQSGSWHIGEPEALPTSTHIMEDTWHLLVSAPLLDNGQVTGSFTLVYPPGHTLSLVQRRAMTSYSKTLGNLARTLELLTTAQKSLEQLGFLHETSQALISTLDLGEVLDNTMELATRILDASASTLMLLDDDTGELVFEIPQGERRELLTRYRMPVQEGIAGWVATHGTPAIVNDATQDQRFSSNADARTGFLTTSVICVPLLFQGRTIGVLEVLNKLSDEGFTDDDLRLLDTLAAQAAIAIENARLYRSLRDEKEIIIRAQEQARHELARDLHDSTIQSLSSIAMHIDYTKRLVQREPDSVAERLDELQEMAVQASEQTRTVLFELRPIVLETEGLAPTLETYVGQLQREKPPAFHFDDGGYDGGLSEEVEVTLFVIIQEAINNARKHSRAQNVWLRLVQDGEQLVVVVEDDGEGFDTEATREAYHHTSRLGLLSMQERAELIDAQLTIQSQPGQGTRAILRVPSGITTRQP